MTKNTVVFRHLLCLNVFVHYVRWLAVHVMANIFTNPPRMICTNRAHLIVAPWRIYQMSLVSGYSHSSCALYEILNSLLI